MLIPTIAYKQIMCIKKGTFLFSIYRYDNFNRRL